MKFRSSALQIHLAFFLCLAGTGVASSADDEAISPPDVGQKAPDFELPMVGENSFIELREEYRNGPVVVVVLRGYPGYQCQMCKTQFSGFVNRAKTLGQHASRVILIYPGEGAALARKAKQFAGSRSVPDPLVLVRDDEMRTITEWGLRWEKHHETAYPATFVIDRNGRVAWKKISKSHAGRGTTDEIIRALRKL